MHGRFGWLAFVAIGPWALRPGTGTADLSSGMSSGSFKSIGQSCHRPARSPLCPH